MSRKSRERKRAREYEVKPAPKPPEVGPLAAPVAFPHEDLTQKPEITLTSPDSSGYMLSGVGDPDRGFRQYAPVTMANLLGTVPTEVVDYAGFTPLNSDEKTTIWEYNVNNMEAVNAVADDGGESTRAVDFEAEALKADISQQLIEWWMDKANSDVTSLVDKMIEYGGLGRASDLAEIGRKMIDAGMPVPNAVLVGVDSKDAYAAEVGIYFYMVGKMSRWSAAIEEGRMVSDDTIHDLKMYATMVQRLRDVGGWPV
jgi:hypothetical protein